ncbi:MAG: 4Fe-4S binding protein [Maledivibacter sp.]|jgi:formate hydrogenlyase subunit 6/NADH:ubiquinone oxidoreductase subunit I|nr:4Fe-4S binding protein [Maledivibacter sp.]
MKILTKNDELCIGCGACEEACSKAFFKEANRDKSCIKVDVSLEKKITACTQCGECMDQCPVLALKRDARGIIRVDKNRCVGCLMCVGYCTEGAMMYHSSSHEPFKCIACGICTRVCPTNALKIEDVEVEMLEKVTPATIF